ncbi:MAG: FAD-dependent oxidoreductase [Deltaproteobacteria bacterium]|nr:FAD-dependent oxidoreductase [Candidatus Zymogenaceae bacterium]
MTDIVIIGLGSAGYAALMSIKRTNPKAGITVIDPKSHDLTHACGLPYALEGMIESAGLVQDIGLSRMKVSRIREHVVSIDTENKSVITRNERVPYDRAIIATGYRPVIPPIEGAADVTGRGLFTLTTPDDLEALEEELSGAGSAVVVGAGAIGLETAVALSRRMSSVMVLEGKDQLLPGVLDDDMAKHVDAYLEGTRISRRVGAMVNGVLSETKDGAPRFCGVTVAGEEIRADLGILAVGFAPNVAVAERSGIECGKNGVVVDERLNTSAPDVFAAGDCIVPRSVIDGKETYIRLATSAYKQGTLAGGNAAGGDEAYRGTAGTFVTKIGGLEVAGTGFSEAEAVGRGYTPAVGKIKMKALPDYMGASDEIAVKVVGDSATGKALGAQVVGSNGAAWRVNIIGMALEYGIALSDLLRLELAYCPAVSEVHDPLLRAVELCIRRMKR